MKDKFEQILKNHGIYGEDIEEIICSVSEMLELMADDTKKNEPYAINSINRMESATREVFGLTNYL